MLPLLNSFISNAGAWMPHWPARQQRLQADERRARRRKAKIIGGDKLGSRMNFEDFSQVPLLSSTVLYHAFSHHEPLADHALCYQRVADGDKMRSGQTSPNYLFSSCLKVAVMLLLQSASTELGFEQRTPQRLRHLWTLSFLLV